MKRAIALLRRCRTWALRVVVSFLAVVGFMPKRLQLEWLYWLLEDIDPQHPHVATVLAEISQLEDRCRA